MDGRRTAARRPARRDQWGSTVAWGALSITIISIGCGGQERSLSTPHQLLIEAQELAAEGKNDQAIEKLDESIAGEPTVWALRLRARLLAERGDDQAALSDCEAALQLAPDDPDVIWIKAELGKPVGQRFKGAFRDPPSFNSAKRRSRTRQPASARTRVKQLLTCNIDWRTSDEGRRHP